jgi:hypothetical protein
LPDNSVSIIFWGNIIIYNHYLLNIYIGTLLLKTFYIYSTTIDNACFHGGGYIAGLYKWGMFPGEGIHKLWLK